MIMAFSINKVKALVIIKNIVLFSEIELLTLPLLYRQTIMKLFWLQHMMYKNSMLLLYWPVSHTCGLEKNMTESPKGWIVLRSQFSMQFSSKC